MSCFIILILDINSTFFQKPNICIKYLTLNAHKMKARGCGSIVVLLKASRPRSSPVLQTKAVLPMWLSLSMQNRSNSVYFYGLKYYVPHNQRTTKEHDNIKAIPNISFFFFELGLYSFPPSQSAFKMIQSVLYALINLSM